MNINKNTLI